MTNFKVGDVVSFELGGETVYGPITGIHDDREHATIKGDIGAWVRDLAELELVYAYEPPPEKREPLWVHTHSLVIPKRQGVDEPAEIDITITIREGATSDMIIETLDHYMVAVRALWDGSERAKDYHSKRKDYGDSPHGEARVCCYGEARVLLPSGKRRTVNINKCHEATTAYELVTSVRQSIEMIGEFYKLAVLEQAQTPQPATLRPSRQRVEVTKLNEPDEEEAIYHNADVEGTYTNHMPAGGLMRKDE